MDDATPEELPDRALVAATVFGDLDAFAELVRRYRRAVIRTATGIVGSEAAEDIAQDALLLAFNALPDLDEPERFAAWLGAITRNRALRWLKNENRVRHVEFDDGLMKYLDAVAAEDRRGKQAAAELVEGLDQLPAEYRLVMRMKWLDEMTLEQISAYSGLPVSTVKWRLHEGKKRLKKWQIQTIAPATPGW